MRVLADSGPEGATVGDIAAEAGVAPGTFYNHFKSLAELVDEVTAEIGTGVEVTDPEGTRVWLERVELPENLRNIPGFKSARNLHVSDPLAEMLLKDLTG